MNQQPKVLTLAERIIVAADFKGTKDEIEKMVLGLVNDLEGTGVIIKVNSALRSCGYGLISRVQSHGLKVFADLKLNDIPATLEIDGILLNEYKPDLLTVMCSTGVVAMRALKAELPDTEVLGVTVLTSMTEKECHDLYGYSINVMVLHFTNGAQEAGIDGLIASPAETEKLRKHINPLMSINTPGVRPLWSVVEDEDQNLDRVMTPAKAIQVGATRLVIGRPITQSPNPREAVMRTLEEIDSAF